MTAPQFVALLTLQELDTALDQARYRRDHLPALAELAEVARAGAQLAARRAAVAAELAAVEARQSTLEADLAATEARRATVSKRLYGGEVSAARDLSALAADIETLTARAEELEDQGLVVLEEREPLDAALVALDAERAALDARAAAASADRAAAEAVVDAETADLAGRRAAAAAEVPADLLATYERLRPRLGGVAVARLQGDHCGGCHLVLPSVELDSVRHLPPDALVTCEQCGRILVRP